MHYYVVSYDIAEIDGRNNGRIRKRLRDWLLTDNHGIRLLRSQYGIKTDKNAKQILMAMMNLTDSRGNKYVDPSVDSLLANSIDIKDAALLKVGRIYDEARIMRFIDRQRTPW